MVDRKTAHYLLIAVIVIAGTISSSSAGIPGVVIYNDGSLQGLTTQKCCAHSVKTVNSPSRAGNSALLVQVNAGDPGVAPHHRAEVALQKNTSVPNQDYWYGWSLMIPDNWLIDQNWVLLTQWHAKGSKVMQPLQLEINGDRWCWVNWIGIQPSAKYNVLWCEPFLPEQGRWVDWVVNANWSNTDSGHIRIWKNGNLILENFGPNIFKTFSPYWKIGLVYSANNKISRTLYIDETRMGGPESSYDEVMPYHTRPNP